MSMSSLSAQLAALNSSRPNSLPLRPIASRRHTDAIGRGLNHSIPHGHSLLKTKNTTTTTPTILSLTATEAADVPLATILSNAKQALLQNLSRRDGRFRSPSILSLFNNNNINKERGLQNAQRNKDIDEIITKNLLPLLSSAAMSSSSSAATGEDCLTVLEYLIRHYEIHARSDTSGSLVGEFLPHHDAAFFGRILQLVDLTSTNDGDTWLFLRIYSKGDGQQVGRDALAKRVAKDVGFVKVLLRVLGRQATLILRGGSNNGGMVMRGSERIISWIGHVLMTGLRIMHDGQGQLSEETLRLIVPYIIRYLSLSSSDGTVAPLVRWSYVMVSVLVSHESVAKDTREMWRLACMNGLIRRGRGSYEEMELMGEGLEVFLLLTPHVDEEGEEGSYLENDVISYGCELTKDMADGFGCLLDQNSESGARGSLAYALGHLWNRRGVNICNLMGGILSKWTSQWIKDGLLEQKDWIRTMIEEPELTSLWTTGNSKGEQQSVTNGNNILALLVHKMLLTYAKHPHKIQASSIQSTIVFFRSTFSSSTDAGIALTIQHSSLKKKSRRSKLAEALQGICSISEKDEMIQLPVSMALVAPDVTTRCDAIRRLLLAEEDSSMKDDDDKSEVLKRIVIEDYSATVARNALRGLRKLSNPVNLSGNDMMAIMSRWELYSSNVKVVETDEKCKRHKRSPSDHHRVVSVTNEELDLISDIIKLTSEMLASEKDVVENTRRRLLLGIASHLECDETKMTKLHKAAIDALYCIFSNNNTTAKKENSLAKLLAASEEWISLFSWCCCCSEEEETADARMTILRQRFIKASLVYYQYALPPPTANFSSQLSSAAVMLLSSSSSKTASSSYTATECETLISIISSSFPSSNDDVEASTALLSTLISTLGGKMYKTVALPVLQKLLATTTTTLPPQLTPLALTILALGSDEERALRCLDLLPSTTTSSSPPPPLIILLALLTHSCREVRKKSLDLLKNTQKLTIDDDTMVTVEMDNNSLELFLVNCCSEDEARIKKLVYSECVKGVVGWDFETLPEVIKKGVRKSVVIVLDAMPQQGLGMWEGVGYPLFQLLLKEEEMRDDDDTTTGLARCIIRMLRGNNNTSRRRSNSVTLTTTVILGRKRSYSWDQHDTASSKKTTTVVLYPYPESMMDSLLQSLENQFTTIVLEEVIRNELWMEEVFAKLNSEKRWDIIKQLFHLRLDDDVVAAGPALMELNLTVVECQKLLMEAASITEAIFVTDIIRNRASEKSFWDDVSQEHNITLEELRMALFERLESYSLVVADDDVETSEGRDAVRHYLLETLVQLYRLDSNDDDDDDSSKQSPKKRPRTTNRNSSLSSSQITTHSLLLAALISFSSSSTTYHPLPSTATTTSLLALQLLTHLCSLSPNTVAPQLLSALSCCAGNRNTQKALEMVIPVLYKYQQDSGLVDRDLYKLLFLGQQKRRGLLPPLISTFRKMNDDGERNVALAIGVYLSCSACDNEEEDDEDEVSFILEILGHVEGKKQQLRCLFYLLDCAGGLLSQLSGGGEEEEEDEDEMEEEESKRSLKKSCIDDLIYFATCDPNDDDDKTNDTKKKKKVYSLSTTINDKNVMWLTTTILSIVRDSLSTPTFQRIIRRSDDDDGDNNNNNNNNNNSAKEEPSNANLCLLLWQRLMHVHSSTRLPPPPPEQHSEVHLTRKFWTSAQEALQECLVCLQTSLPVSHFLASVMSLLRSSSTDGSLRKRALQLLSERAEDVSSKEETNAEKMLFWECIGDLVQLIKDYNNYSADDDERQAIMVSQSAIVAIERIARSLYHNNRHFEDDHDDDNEEEKVLTPKMMASYLTPAMESMVTLMETTQNVGIVVTNNDSGATTMISMANNVQLFATASLCTSTLITILQARCLAHLPRLMACLINGIQNTTTTTTSQEEMAGRLLRHSIMKCLHSITTTLFTFLKPYMGSLLDPRVLPRIIVMDDGVVAGEKQTSTSRDDGPSRELCRALATKLSPRVLLPPLLSSLSASLSSVVDGKTTTTTSVMGKKEAEVLLGLLTTCLKTSSRKELTPFVSSLLTQLLSCFDVPQDDDDVVVGGSLVDAANEALMAMIMKVSETKLRALYNHLQGWKSDVDDGDEDAAMDDASQRRRRRRRYAFWSINAILAKNLKGIFLPCLSTDDIIEELNYYITASSSSETADDDDGNRKRKRNLSPSITIPSLGNNSNNNHHPLIPLFCTLTRAFKSDAHEGGSWIRSDDGGRYHRILEPLSRLLLNNIHTTLSYNDMVFGCSKTTEEEKEDGTLIATLTSLAVAAGDEILWKPLNHAIVRACCHDDDSSFSKIKMAGITLLLSILKVVGEEYVVLLPECLPVLSELMEERDEGLVGVARECVEVAEEILGESLEDSLR